MKTKLLICAILLVAIAAQAQVKFRSGISMNPTVCYLHANKGFEKSIDGAEFTKGNSQVHTAIGVAFRVELNSGVEILTGLNYIQKGYKMYYTNTVSNELMVGVETGVNTNNVEIPLLLGYNIRKSSAPFYKMVPYVGVSLNRINYTEPIIESNRRLYNNSSFEYAYDFNSKTNDINQSLVVGIDVFTLVKGIGAVEYGISYQLDINKPQPINVVAESTINDIHYSHQNTFQPRSSFLCINLRYYFSNLIFEGKSIKKIEYKGVHSQKEPKKSKDDSNSFSPVR